MKKKVYDVGALLNIKPSSKAMLWDNDAECPQCGDSSKLFWMECCGLVMCEGCRYEHDKKKGFLTEDEKENS